MELFQLWGSLQNTLDGVCWPHTAATIPTTSKCQYDSENKHSAYHLWLENRSQTICRQMTHDYLRRPYWNREIERTWDLHSPGMSVPPLKQFHNGFIKKMILSWCTQEQYISVKEGKRVQVFQPPAKLLTNPLLLTQDVSPAFPTPCTEIWIPADYPTQLLQSLTTWHCCILL